ncbi:autotransporter outer membrane beta-barrel domain-containing protein [Jannaschia faecimaris]|uniref:autotransporter outer membrane beta-barrel domain-containing protein n=1 Tax=Jannaschia faecimaris TaxID=1244108 RepID=UPI001479D2D2|nr:autotransporter outer membrane beta-barrel domain-containing protein [Jannaschia faecimaris]
MNGAILGWPPAVAAQLSALSQGSASLSRGIVIMAGEVAATKANDGLSTGTSTTTASSRGTDPTAINTWVKFTGFVVNGNDLRQTATGFQLGGDMHVMSNLALGLSIGHSEVNSNAGGFDLSGDLTFIQPYLAYVNGPMRAEASLIYGRGDFEQVSLGGTGTADTTLVAATLSGAYDYVLAEGHTLSPMASLSYGKEESKGTGGTLAGAGTETTTFGRASIGARYTRAFDIGTAFVGAHADYDYSNGDANLIAGFDDDTGLAGRVELGVNAAITDRLNLRTNMSVGGLGTSTKDVAAGLTLSMSF